MADPGYFEGQSSKDCVIHSLNNAFGWRVVTKPEVLDYINRRVEEEMAKFRNNPNITDSDLNKREKVMRARYSSGKTFFAADVVWDCAKNKGAYKLHTPIPGFTTPFLRMEAMTPEVMSHPIVLLGGNSNGGTHAVALRMGMIYDSERTREGPRPLSREELKESLPKVFGAYAFLQRPEDATAVRRSFGVVRSFQD
jgi:hypothetical protein